MRIELNGYVIKTVLDDCYGVFNSKGTLLFWSNDREVAIQYVRNVSYGE